MLSRLLPLAALMLLALPATASAALSYGEAPRTGAATNGTVSFPVAAASENIGGAFLRVGDWTSPVVRSFPATFTYDTTTLPEGAHTFEIVTEVFPDFWVLDRAWSITVDRTAPAAGPVPAGPTQITTTEERVGLQYTLPAGESGAVEGTVCAATCAPLAQPAAIFPGRGLAVPLVMGTTTVRAWIRDRAGNANPANATVWTITRTAPAPAAPRPRVDPRLRITSVRAGADRRTITVGGTLGIPHTNHVSVRVRARYGKRTRTVRTIAVTSGHGFRTQLRLPSARWSSATVIARVAGSSRYLTVEKRKAVHRARR